MKKLFFVFAVIMLGAGFMACEQEEVKPVEEFELHETSEPGDGGEDEVSGDRPGGN